MATAESLLKVARSQLGQGEHPPGSNHNKFSQWYGMGDGPWCDMFVSWCADQAGATGIVGHFAYTPYHAGWFQDHGRWGQRPSVGAIIFFDWGGSHSIDAIDHVGIVEAVRADGSVVTIEGNTSDLVMRRVRRSGIAGYGYPAYAAAPKPPPVKPPVATPSPWSGRLLRQPPIMRGNDVTWVQRRLNAHGAMVAIDGDYGPKTAAGVKAFQHAHHLATDSVVGPKTWAALAKKE